MLGFLFSLFVIAFTCPLRGDNQTPGVSLVFQPRELPFTIEIEKASLELPNGVQSFVSAVWDGKWLILAGRTNGLHGFNNTNNFPPQEQNRTAYVIDYKASKIWSRPLDTHSGLSFEQIDLLSVTNAQSYQSSNKLYIAGGYGVVTKTGELSTKNALTEIDVPGFMKWVMRKSHHNNPSKFLQTIYHETFRVTGGAMAKVGDGPTLLIFGQDFEGEYTSDSNGIYTQQVRRFEIHSDNGKLSCKFLLPNPELPNPNYRRRDLNVVPVIEYHKKKETEALVAYGGVFTLSNGVWTVPVDIASSGFALMDNPSDFRTFKQAMNQYTCATCGLFSQSEKEMYTILFGGLSFGFFQNGQFMTDAEIPFINQVTTIRRDKERRDQQFLMQATFPQILSTASNPGNPLLFGANATFFPSLETFPNGVIKFDILKQKEKRILGHIVGGIQSTLPNTNSESDSAASPYIFTVYITPK
jgi:hypothetical protein